MCSVVATLGTVGHLLSGLIGASISRLPGVAVPLSRTVEFLAPGHPGEKLTAVCEVVEDLGDDTYRLRTRVANQDDDLLVDGEAMVVLDDLPSDDRPADFR